MTRREPPPGTQAIRRGIRLLKALSRTDGELTLLELSTAAELTKTTAHRLLAAMESEGLVVRGLTQNTYRLGPAVVAMGVHALRTSDLRATVRPALDFLAEKTGETATLEILSDNEMLTLDEVSGPHLVSAAVEIGMRWPLHATSTGKAILAHLPEEQRRRLLKPPLAKLTPATITNSLELRRELEHIRSVGYATGLEELEVGFNAVGVAFWGPMGNVVGAISVGGPTHRVGRQALRSLGMKVKKAAESISERLGHETESGRSKGSSRRESAYLR